MKNEFGAKFFTVKTPTRALVYNVENCPKCGIETEAANTINVTADDIRAALTDRGMIERAALPTEGIWPLPDGDYGCGQCHEKATAAAELRP